jgi:hypothetical protein
MYFIPSKKLFITYDTGGLNDRIMEFIRGIVPPETLA